MCLVVVGGPDDFHPCSRRDQRAGIRGITARAGDRRASGKAGAAAMTGLAALRAGGRSWYVACSEQNLTAIAPGVDDVPLAESSYFFSYLFFLVWFLFLFFLFRAVRQSGKMSSRWETVSGRTPGWMWLYAIVVARLERSRW
jgi:hypothetical protein